MKYALDAINKGLIKLLETDNSILYYTDKFPAGTPVLVYTETPNSAKFPAIILTPRDMGESDVSRGRIGQTHSIDIELITKYKTGFGGWGSNTNMVNQIMELIRIKNSFMDLSAEGFLVTKQSILSTQPIKESYKDGVYFRTIVILEVVLEEI